MFCEKHIQTIQKKKWAGIRKLYGGLIATGAVISTISLPFDLVFYVARKKEIYEVLRMYRGLSPDNVDTIAIIGAAVGIILMVWGTISKQKEIYIKNSMIT